MFADFRNRARTGALCFALLLALAGAGHTVSAATPSEKLAEQLFAQGNERSIAGDSTGARKLYADGLALSPRNTAARVSFAHLLRNAGQLDNAILVLKDGVGLNDGDAVLHVRLGELLEDNDDESAARTHYARAVELAPNSNAAADANANLSELDSNQVSVDPNAPSRLVWSSGAGSAPGASRKTSVANSGTDFERLKTNLDGDWCLQWTDRYRQVAGSCVSNPNEGDLVLSNVGAEVTFRVNDENGEVVYRGLDEATGDSWPSGEISAIDLSFGDRSQIQTLRYGNQRYIEFNFQSGGKRCMQVQTNRRDEEHLRCADRHTFCSCS